MVLVCASQFCLLFGPYSSALGPHVEASCACGVCAALKTESPRHWPSSRLSEYCGGAAVRPSVQAAFRFGGFYVKLMAQERCQRYLTSSFEALKRG